MIETLLKAHPLISEQVNKEQIRVILHELTRTIAAGAPGAIVEFGCYKGTTSVFIRRLLMLLGDARDFHVYDSFEGLPPKSAQDTSGAGEQFVAGALAVSKKQFLAEFHKANLTPPIVHKGWFSELPETAVPDQIALAFLDGDFYQSIKDSLRLILPRMSPGGTIIIDDYAREALPGAAKAVHEHFRPDQITVAHNLGVIRMSDK